jgi:hypothetical protein
VTTGRPARRAVLLAPAAALALILVSAAPAAGPAGATAVERPSATEERLQLPTRRPGLAVLTRSVSTYVDDVGATHIVGEVINRGAVNRWFVSVRATIRYQGAPAEVVPAYACRSVIPRGERSPFEIQLFARRPVAAVSFTVVGVDTRRSRSLGIRFVPPQEPFYDPTSGALFLGGEVRNLSNVFYWYPAVCGSLYGQDGRVLRTTVSAQAMYTYQLPPRQKNLFNIFFQVVPPAFLGQYRWALWAEGCTNRDVNEAVCSLDVSTIPIGNPPKRP